MGTKPCIILQGPLFESDETLQRLGNLMIDWFRGTKVEMVRLQGLELVIALTALSKEQVLFRVYKSVFVLFNGKDILAFRAVLKKAEASSLPRVELLEIGPQIDFKLDRKKFASDELYKTAMKKPKLIQVFRIILQYNFRIFSETEEQECQV